MVENIIGIGSYNFSIYFIYSDLYFLGIIFILRDLKILNGVFLDRVEID